MAKGPGEAAIPTTIEAGTAVTPTLAERCTGRHPDGSVDPVADRLLMRVAKRRTWAFHRHVHLIAAFLAADDRQPISTVLAVGSGTGLSELFLARMFPDVHVTVTDLDEVNLAGPRAAVAELGLDKVSVEALDLLAPRPRDRADFVTSIEALEHIDDDRTAAANLLDHRGARRPARRHRRRRQHRRRRHRGPGRRPRRVTHPTRFARALRPSCPRPERVRTRGTRGTARPS